MSTDKILPVETGSLVIFTPNKGNGHLGIVTSMNDGEVAVYGFVQRVTFSVPLNSCLPFRKEDYVAMCEQNFWEGVIVQFPNKKQGVVQSGRMDVFGQDCVLVIKAGNQTYEGVPLSGFEAHLKTLGHINSINHQKEKNMTEEKPRLPPIVGKPLWYQGKGDLEPQLGFLEFELIKPMDGNELFISLIAGNSSQSAGKSECWLAHPDECKGDWTGILCTHPNWGAGIIRSSNWDDVKKDVYLVIASEIDGQPKTYYLSEVVLDRFTT